MPIVVSNSSPLIALARIQRLDLVPAILHSILIPPAVAREIAPRGLIESVRDELDNLLGTSFFLTPELYDHVLRLADEPTD